MTTLLRNKKKNSVLITLTGHPALQFYPLGDRNGADAVLVEDEVASSVAVKNAIRQGLIELVPDEDVDAVLEDSDSRLAAGQVAATTASTATVEHVQNRDLIANTCIGPGARDGLVCGATIIRSQAVQQGDAPPLCGQHEHLSGLYFQTEVEVEQSQDSPGGPVTKQVWKRVEVTRPQRNLA